MMIDPSGMAGEDPKEAQRVSSTVALGAAVAGVVGGVLEVTFGIGAIVTPTGVGQIGGAALVTMGVGTISFSFAKMVDAVDAITNDRAVADIPTGYGELGGGGLDVMLGGDGEAGQVVGGLLQGVLSGKLVTAGMQSVATSGQSLLVGPVGDGARNATLGLEIIASTHSIVDWAGLLKSQPSRSSDAPVAAAQSSRFQSVMTPPGW
jgi:hypothetical protein